MRRSVEITGRRYPHGAELLAAPHGAVVVSCNIITRQGDSLDVELAMSDAALTGFSGVDRVVRAGRAHAPRH